MPFTTDFKEDGAVLRYSGRTTGAEIFAAKDEFFKHRFPGAVLWLLCDFTDVEHFAVTTGEVQRIVRQDLASVESHPELAEVVIAPTAIQYGMARMWELQVEKERPRTLVARTREEAIAWLAQQGVRVAADTP